MSLNARHLLRPSSWLAVLLRLDTYQRYRRWWGSHWELWQIDFPVCGEIWHDMELCTQQEQIDTELPVDARKDREIYRWITRQDRSRPNPLCRGTPVCEDYAEVDDPLDAEFIG